METYLKAKSIHVFAWPFFVSDEKSERNTFKNRLEEKGWLKTTPEYRMTAGDVPKTRNFFMLEQYLSGKARHVYLNKEDKACQIYEYPFKGEKAVYRIVTQEGKTYDLLIDSIELHVYAHNVGVLFFKTLNIDEKTTIKDIKLINNKGRNIALPFIPDSPEGGILCAESVGILFGEKEHFTDFRKMIRDYYSAGVTGDALERFSKTADFLYDVINVNLDNSGINDIEVNPTTDDRMYVMSMIRDGYLTRQLQQKEWRESRWGEETLYSIFFIDSDDATCQYGEMRKLCLKEAMYSRWLDWGTVYGMTEYSFVGITAEIEGINASVVRPFYVEYVYMISLIMAQRVTIMKFSEEAGRLAGKIKNGRRLLARRLSKQLLTLQKNYVVFLNRMMLAEFSCQEQGLELYDMMQKRMLVEKERDLLDAKLQGLYEIVNISNGTRSSGWSLLWAVLAIVIALVPYLAEGVQKLLLLIGGGN